MPKQNRSSSPAPTRGFWSGTISFGLVTVPVELFPATSNATPSLRMLDQQGAPLSRRYYCPAHEKPVEREHIVRGFPVGDDEFVVVDDEELRAAAPKKSREIDLRQFVKREEIPPLHFNRAYYLTPKGESNKAYRLLTQVMEEQDRAGIATFVMRGREYLVAVIARDGILRAETLRFEDEVRSPEDVGLPQRARAEKTHVKELKKLIRGHHVKELPMDSLHDEGAAALRELAEKKARAGKDVVDLKKSKKARAAAAEADSDLLEAIRRSLKGGDGKTKAAAKEDLGERSRDELYHLAQELNIAGRSNMNKQQLAGAIRNQQPG